MLYEVRARLFFNSLVIPQEIKTSLLTVWQHAQVVNPGQENEECSFVDLLNNYHDEDPNKPCQVIFHKDNRPD